MSDEIDRLVEAARLLGSTQAKKAHGTYGPADARIERAWYEAIYSHSRNLQARIAELEAALAEAKRDAERAATRLELTKRETTMLRNQRDELRLVLDKRPAMNAGLLEAYAAWSASVYALDWLDAGDDAMRKEGGE